MATSAVDAIGPAFQHTKQQLFQPFRAGQWARLALVGFLAGELSSGGCNSSTFHIPNHGNGTQKFLDLPFELPSLPHMDPMTMAALIASLIVAGMVLWILFLYVNSVMRFILFDSIIAKRCEIGRGWSRRQGPGSRYFVWQIVYSLALLGGITILVGIPAAFAFALGWLKDPQQHMVPLILGGMVLFLLFLAFLLVALLVHLFTKDFVVPQMALEDISAFEGWRRFWPRVKTELGGYAGYVGMKIIMALGAAVVVGIVTFFVVLILLIPVGGFGVVAVLAGKAAGLSWNLYTITLAVLVGCGILGLFLYVVSLISVPVIVFFPAYSIYFFAARYPALQAVLRPAPPIPPLAPPLPPQPEPIG